MSVSTILLVAALWTVVALFAGLRIGKYLRRRTPVIEVKRRPDMRNSA